MRTDIAEVADALPSPKAIKVHRPICEELIKVLVRITEIFPEIEAARPGCSLGIQTLCLLKTASEKAKSLLLYCSESSKLYLALTGNVILSRCKKARNLLEQGLSQIQEMVPVHLAAEISHIISDLRSATFTLDPYEEEAGKAVRELIQQYASPTDPAEESVVEAIRYAASRLGITSQKTLLFEKRSIRKLLDKIGDGEPKKQILQFLLKLLKKYGNLIVKHEDSCSVSSSFDRSVEAEPLTQNRSDEALIDMPGRPLPPEEFMCPISCRLMYDPVVIDSGQTFERTLIQKWFAEGHNTCPKTKRKLDHLALIPNTSLKDLISKWCVMHDVSIPDPCVESTSFQSWETSSGSIASLGSSMNDLHLPIDFSNASIGSLYHSDSSSYSPQGSIVMSTHTNDDFHKFLSCANTKDTRLKFLSKLDELPWRSQCKALEDLRSQFKRTNQACTWISSEDFVVQLVLFLKGAHDMQDIKALRIGCLLLLEFVSKCRSSIQYLTEDAYSLLASFLDSEVIEEALTIMEVMSCHHNCTPKIAASGALTFIAGILDSPTRSFKEAAVKILHNLSLNSDICSVIVSLGFIPKLVPFLEDTSLVRDCICILKNLCDEEDARACIVETDGCIACIVKLLDNGDCENQEHASTILLSLCSQRVQYCRLAMDEGVLPALLSLTINGNEKGKACAMELLRLLRDIDYEDKQECSEFHAVSADATCIHSKAKKPFSNTIAFFGRISLFSKSRPLAPKRKK